MQKILPPDRHAKFSTTKSTWKKCTISNTRYIMVQLLLPGRDAKMQKWIKAIFAGEIHSGQELKLSNEYKVVHNKWKLVWTINRYSDLGSCWTEIYLVETRIRLVWLYIHPWQKTKPRKKVWPPKKMILIRGIAFEKNGPCSWENKVKIQQKKPYGQTSLFEVRFGSLRCFFGGFGG